MGISPILRGKMGISPILGEKMGISPILDSLIGRIPIFFPLEWPTVGGERPWESYWSSAPAIRRRRKYGEQQAIVF
jgi:hypothetical protein